MTEESVEGNFTRFRLVVLNLDLICLLVVASCSFRDRVHTAKQLPDPVLLGTVAQGVPDGLSHLRRLHIRTV